VVLKQSTPYWNVTDMGGVKQTIDNNYLNILIILIDVSGLKRLKHLKRMGGIFPQRRQAEIIWILYGGKVLFI
jgi:hypothetical protein